jgi:putative ABC transport system substrate-binding protein
VFHDAPAAATSATRRTLARRAPTHERVRKPRQSRLSAAHPQSLRGLVPRIFQIGDANELATAIATARRKHVDAVLVLPSPAFDRYRWRIAELALKQKLATCSESSEYLRDGGLLLYGPDFRQMYYQEATYVNRILKGDKPGDLPVARPSKFEPAVNLKTAKALDIAIPQSLLLRADEVIP